MRHRLLIPLLFIIAFSACNSSPKTIEKKSKTETPTVATPTFDADSAYQFVANQCEFGPRVPGTAAWEACAEYLVSTLDRFADTTFIQSFEATTYDGVVRSGKNIIGAFAPEKSKRIFLCAHWDSRPFSDYDEDEAMHNTPIDGANDGASGVGVLLELARIMAEQNPTIGVDIILFDLEDFGPPQDDQRENGTNFWGLGSQHWALTPHSPNYNAAYGILLDMVGDPNAKFLMEAFSLHYAPHIVKKVWNSAERMGYDNYFLEERGGAITDDHYFINTIAGIPTIDIIHLENTTDAGTFVHYWHTQGDSMDKIDPTTLGVVGKVITQVVYNEK